MVNARTRLLSPLLATGVLVACRPELAEPGSVLEAPTLLAVQAEPAEAKPGEALSLRATYVGADGVPLTGAAIAWARCTARKSLSEPGPVDPACLYDPSVLVAIGAGARVDATLPADACRTFGPEQPTPAAGAPAARAYDPDPTGGFYVPFRFALPAGSRDAVGLFEARVRCDLAGASGAQSADFGRRYRTNGAPAIAGLKRLDTGAAIAPAAGAADPPGLVVRPGERVLLRAEVDACPAVDACGDGVCGIDDDASACAADCAAPKRCAGAERYLWFDPAARALVTRRETLRFSWYASAGSLDEPRTGRAEEDLATFTDDGFVAPTSGSGWIWIVARDDRGGASARGHRFVVQP
jgi:hypothetical protein